MGATIPHLIINSPFAEPAQQRHYDRAKRSFKMGGARGPPAPCVA